MSRVEGAMAVRMQSRGTLTCNLLDFGFESQAVAVEPKVGVGRDITTTFRFGALTDSGPPAAIGES